MNTSIAIACAECGWQLEVTTGVATTDKELQCVSCGTSAKARSAFDMYLRAALYSADQTAREEAWSWFDVLYGQPALRVLKYQFNALGPDIAREMAKECLQDVYSEIFQSPHFLDPATDLLGFVKLVVYRTMIDRLRKERQGLTGPLTDSIEQKLIERKDLDPEKKSEANETRKLIRSELMALPSKYREVVKMRDIDELTYEEIALALDVELGTVKSRLYRGRQMIRDRLNQKL